MPTNLTSLRLSELSLVDFPANIGAKVAIWKRDTDPFGDGNYPSEILKREFTAAERESMAGKGQAMPGGGFPIADTADLKNAIQAIGRAKDPAAAKKHIISRARSLGATDLLPDGWVSKTAGDGNNPDHDGDVHMDDKEIQKKIDEAVATATAKLADDAKTKDTSIAKLTAENALLKLSDVHKKYMADSGMDETAKAAFIAKSAEDRDAHIAKNPIKKAELPEEVRKQLADGQAALVEVNKLRDERELDAVTKRVEAFGAPAAIAKHIHAVAKATPEAAKALEAAIKGLVEQVSTGKVFAEFGKSGGDGNGATAYEQMVAKAAELRKTEKGLTKEGAFSKVYEDPANAELVQTYKREKRQAA